jgi:hypothetical protein
MARGVVALPLSFCYGDGLFESVDSLIPGDFVANRKFSAVCGWRANLVIIGAGTAGLVAGGSAAALGAWINRSQMWADPLAASTSAGSIHVGQLCRRAFSLPNGCYHSILKFFQVDKTGRCRMTSSARYFQ